MARAAIESGVATRRIEDWDAYLQGLNEFVYHSGLVMKPVFSQARMAPKRIVFAEGEDERVLRAVQVVRDEGIAWPILIGRQGEIDRRIAAAGLRIRAGEDFEVAHANESEFFDAHYEEFWTTYHRLMARKGVSPEFARREERRRNTLCGALMLRLDHADGLICGTFGRHETHREYVQNVIGTRDGLDGYYAMNLLILPGRTVFIGDIYVNYDPTVSPIRPCSMGAARRMLALVQRVARASVVVDGRTVGRIGGGLLVLVCAERGDSEAESDRLLAKLLKLRIFADEQGRMNRSVQDVGGGLLIVSQFTLAADTSGGNRPSFTNAAAPDEGRRLFEYFVRRARESHAVVQTGEFGAAMQVELINDGPVTIPLRVAPARP